MTAFVQLSIGSAVVPIVPIVSYAIGMLVIWAFKVFKVFKESRKGSDAWSPGVVLGYRRVDGTIFTKSASDDWDYVDLESWAEKKSLKADAAEAWVSYATPEGKIRNYWVNGEPDRTEKDS